MFQPRPDRRPPRPADNCEIDVKRTKTGVKIRVRGNKCSKEMMEYAKEKAQELHEGESRRIQNE